MDVRPYDADRDGAELWALKRAFERGLGTLPDDEARAEAYAEKLTDGYRDRYLAWVRRCVEESPDCVQVADAGAGLVGYAFVLPESLAMIWDAAVLNEIYVDPDHRGTGVADGLLEAVLAVVEGQSLPIDRVALDVSSSNDRARAFYERHGFEPWAELVAKYL